MKAKVIIAACLALSFPLTGCQLEVASPTTQSRPAGSVATKTPESIPSPGTLPVATSTQTSVPDTRPAEPTARFILQKSADAMMRVHSYDYTSSSVAEFGDTEVVTTTKATIHPLLGNGKIMTKQADILDTTYLLNHRMYMEDPSTGSWVYLDMPVDKTSTIRIHARVNDYIDVTRSGDDIILVSTHPLSALEFYSLTGIEIKEKDTLAQMEAQGQTMETMVEFILDQEYRYKKVSYEQVTTTAGVSTHTVTTYDYSNYNSAPEIELPDKIHKEAVPYQPEGNE